MKKNLIMTAAIGFQVSQLQFFIKSLRKYYKEDVCVIIGSKDKKIEEELLKNNCICIKTNIDKRDIQLKRYKIFLEFLKDKSYNQILFCDSRDIYFQSNPFQFSYKGSINFFLEDKKIKDCKFNSEWFVKTYGQKILDELSDKIISCGGTILGYQNSIVKFLSLMIEELKKHKFKKRLKFILTFRRDKGGRGSDQAHGNFIAHKNLIEDSFFYPNKSGPIATVYHLEEINFNNEHQLINSLKKPYAVVHQFDKRWDKFSSQVNILKKKLNID
tara:strand:+ start:3304 stop:4119 length:816 start_codon:yes stop_codon:yes gene_type:complete